MVRLIPRRYNRNKSIPTRITLSIRMAKFRSIWKETFDDEDLAAFPFGCRWLFIGMWLFADDNGIIRASAKWIKPKVFPYDDVRLKEVEQWLSNLETARMIIPISFREESYYVIRTFDKRQKVDKRYASYIIPQTEAEPLLKQARKVPTGDKIILEEIRKDKKEGAIETGEESFSDMGENEKKGDPPGSGAPPLEVELIIPWNTEQFLCHWRIWKEYKWQEFKFKYKSTHSEQMALKTLAELSEGKEDKALLIINQSIANTWKGLFELKQSINGQGATAAKSANYNDYKRELAQRMGGGSG